ncbi:MAG: 3-methyl-2-oxobutanoate dehydrogenase subunit beta [Clostridiales Family XIII bacterium]|nr:3-methyl-2-oxobutanoate dehydrogenase subunit beta [Clostridiales Family XIII bacterium]
MAKELLKGNEALAEAALRGGCTFYSGYPITPQTEVMEYLSDRMPEIGRTFIQAESEIAAISQVMGAAWTGEKALTSSSGPGVSLKQEGISYIAHNNFPCVILNVCRWGNGLGSLDSAQTDYNRETRGGGQGDYRCIVMAPASIQEGVDMMYDAYDVAEEYHNPVVILTEAMLGQMIEGVNLPEFKPVKKLGLIRPYGRAGKDYMEKYAVHYNRMVDELERWESIQTEDADYVLVAFGMPSRVCTDVVSILRGKGEKVGLIRPINLWPFPFKAFEGIRPKAFITVETNETGQLVDDVAIAAKKSGAGDVPVYCLATHHECADEEAVLDYFEKVKSGSVKERY